MQLKQKESAFGNLVGLLKLLLARKSIDEAVQLAGTMQKLLENSTSNIREFYKQEFVRVLDSIKTTCDAQEYQASWQAGYCTQASLDTIHDIYYSYQNSISS